MPPVPQGMSTDNVIFSADTVTQRQVEEYRQVAIAALPDAQTLDRIIGLYYEQMVSIVFTGLRMRITGF